ncbi:MAG: hypothetical protein Q9209_007810 [Squamulea sp. 1 TL-2023]
MESLQIEPKIVLPKVLLSILNNKNCVDILRTLPPDFLNSEQKGRLTQIQDLFAPPPPAYEEYAFKVLSKFLTEKGRTVLQGYPRNALNEDQKQVLAQIHEHFVPPPPAVAGLSQTDNPGENAPASNLDLDVDMEAEDSSSLKALSPPSDSAAPKRKPDDLGVIMDDSDISQSAGTPANPPKRRGRPPKIRDTPANTVTTYNAWKDIQSLTQFTQDVATTELLRSADSTNGYSCLHDHRDLLVQSEVLRLFRYLLVNEVKTMRYDNTNVKSMTDQDWTELLEYMRHKYEGFDETGKRSVGIFSEPPVLLGRRSQKLARLCSRFGKGSMFLLSSVLTDRFIDKHMTLQGQSYEDAMKHFTTLELAVQAEACGGNITADAIMGYLCGLYVDQDSGSN